MKNIHVFNTTLPSANELNLAVQESEFLFKECAENQLRSFGFNGQYPVTKLSNGLRIDFLCEQKSLPVAAIRREMGKRLQASVNFNSENKPSKKYMNELKEEVVLDLIKKALPQLTGFSAYYHTDSKSLIIDTAKEDFAKLAISTLCHTLKAIETTTLHVSGVSNSLSQNILDCINTNKELGFAGFEYANKLHLANPDGETVKFQCEYTLDHVKELLESGYTVKRVGISRDSMSFDLTDDFKIKSIKSNIEQQETETKEEAEINEQEAQLTIMAGNLLELVTFFNKAA